MDKTIAWVSTSGHVHGRAGDGSARQNGGCTENAIYRRSARTGYFNALDQLQEQGVDIGDIDMFVHGTTLGVNTLIERNGAVTGLLVTQGFRDILEIRRLRLEDTTNLYGDKTEALVPRYLVKEIEERALASGDVLQPLNKDQLVQAVDELVNEGITALAISFMHSYANPAHEKEAEEMIKERYPQLFICRSSAIWPQQREFERTLATAMNAYVGERMGSYFVRLQEGIHQYGLKANLLSTMSNGGIMTAASAAMNLFAPCSRVRLRVLLQRRILPGRPALIKSLRSTWAAQVWMWL